MEAVLDMKENITNLKDLLQEKRKIKQNPNTVPNHQAVPVTVLSSQITTNKNIQDIHSKSTRKKASILKQKSTTNHFRQHQAAPVKQHKITGVLSSTKLLFKEQANFNMESMKEFAQQSVTTVFCLFGPDFKHPQQSGNQTRQTKRKQAGMNTAPCTTASKQTVKGCCGFCLYPRLEPP